MTPWHGPAPLRAPAPPRRALLHTLCVNSAEFKLFFRVSLKRGKNIYWERLSVYCPVPASGRKLTHKVVVHVSVASCYMHVLCVNRVLSKGVSIFSWGSLATPVVSCRSFCMDWLWNSGAPEAQRHRSQASRESKQKNALHRGVRWHDRDGWEATMSTPVLERSERHAGVLLWTASKRRLKQLWNIGVSMLAVVLERSERRSALHDVTPSETQWEGQSWKIAPKNVNDERASLAGTPYIFDYEKM